MIALPIPDRTSPVHYEDLVWRGRNLGDVVEVLTRGKKRRSFGAHLDPDLRPEARPRLPGWRPMLGQVGAAQGHLRNQAVGVGDLFVFWGLFRRVDADLRWHGPPLHVVWGWLQVGAVARIDADVRPALNGAWRWAADHPHLAFRSDPSNNLYVAADGLVFPGARATGLRGGGALDTFNVARQLTAPGARKAGSWRLPSRFLPGSRTPLSYHGKPERWTDRGEHVLLDTASRGQEFVLDVDQYPEAIGWVEALLRP